MRSGKLRHQITILRDASGEETLTPDWQVFESDVPCKVEDIRGDETTTRQDQVEAVATVKITLRHLDYMSTDYRVLYRTRTLDVVDVKEDGLDHEMVLMCRENAA